MCWRSRLHSCPICCRSWLVCPSSSPAINVGALAWFQWPARPPSSSSATTRCRCASRSGPDFVDPCSVTAFPSEGCLGVAACLLLPRPPRSTLAHPHSLDDPGDRPRYCLPPCIAALFPPLSSTYLHQSGAGASSLLPPRYRSLRACRGRVLPSQHKHKDGLQVD